MYYSAGGRDLRIQNLLDVNTSQKFLEIALSGRKLTSFFEKTGVHTIAIAPFDYFAKCLIESIDLKSIRVTGIYDKMACNFPTGFKGIDVKDYHAISGQKADMYVVTNNYYQNEIIDTLIGEGVNLEKIVGINTILFGLECMK